MHDDLRSISTAVLVIVLLTGQAGRLRGQAWVQTSAPTNGWLAVACSADGQRIVSGAMDGIYTSADGGTTWVKTSAPTDAYSCLAASADGMKVVAAASGSRIYTSTNGGATWRPCNVPTNSWRVLKCSGDGTKLVAGFIGEFLNGGLYTSVDTGASWLLSKTITNDCLSVAASADGTRLIATTRNIASPGGYIGRIYRSTDSGATWTPTSGETSLNLVASSDGAKAVIAIGAGGGLMGTGGGLFVTTNSGAELQLTSAPNAAWSSIATSADGQRVVAVVGQEIGPMGYSITGAIYGSVDSGTTWTMANAPTNSCWSSVASSADGHKLVAVANYDFPGIPQRGGSIYTMQTISTPVLNVQASGIALLLSWTVPSMNFVLQQTSDLSTGTWTESGATPVLNYASLQLEATLPKPQGSTFYRLVLR